MAFHAISQNTGEQAFSAGASSHTWVIVDPGAQTG
jgi:hypothetical protein